MSYTNGLDDPTLFFEAFAYTGDGNQHVNFTSSFQPDWVWFKVRNNTYDHQLHDSVRGVTAGYLDSATNVAQQSSYQLDSFDSDGVTTDGSNITGVNGNTHLQSAWCWKTGTSFTNDASSTGIGSIDSAGSVNNDAGISICTHTGTGSTATIKHGLSTAPKMIITKKRSATGGWQVGHESIGWGNGVYLNDTDASTGDAGAWNSTAPTSSIFTVGNSSFTNQSSATYVSYIFAEKQGYSKFSSFVGNGNADGTFIYLGFKPAFFIVKNTSASGYNWEIRDNKRDPHNVVDHRMYADTNGADASGNPEFDFVSTGIKIRGNGNNYNTSGSTYIYMAFAESPFVNSKGVPNNAR